MLPDALTPAIGVNVFALECPLTPMLFNTSWGPSGWGQVYQWKVEALKVTLNLPHIGDGPVFLGWNRTPSGLGQGIKMGHADDPKSVQAFNDAWERCDRRVTGRNAGVVTLHLNVGSSGWKTYVSAGDYNSYAGLIRRHIDEHAFGSIVVGFRGEHKFDMDKERLSSLVKVDCVMSLRAKDAVLG